MADPRTLGRAVLAPGFTVAKALVGLRPHEIDEAIALYEGARPLMETDPGLEGEEAKKIGNWLRPIGAKVAPDLSAEQATTWRSAMTLALSDLPARVAISAARRAVHKPMNFLNQAEGIIREIAEEIEDRHRLALFRLRTMRAEIERAANPAQKQITDRTDDPITVSEVAGWLPEYRRMAVENGFITAEIKEAAEALAEERNASIDTQA